MTRPCETHDQFFISLAEKTDVRHTRKEISLGYETQVASLPGKFDIRDRRKLTAPGSEAS